MNCDVVDGGIVNYVVVDGDVVGGGVGDADDGVVLVLMF